MAVERIEQYRQKNGTDILKVYTAPTKVFPNGGYFYAPAEAERLVRRYVWSLKKRGNRVDVYGKDDFRNNIMFHTELFDFYHGYHFEEAIDHYNHVTIDNTDENLNAISQRQNSHNRFTRGYNREKNILLSFRPQVQDEDIAYRPCGHYRRNEDTACKQQNWLEKVWLKEKMGNQYYIFDFKKYRKGSEDILDLERTGKISEEEAIYRHILRYSDNAWYILRFGLEDYCRQYHIPIPQYALDSNGFMVHPITGQTLCPFHK